MLLIGVFFLLLFMCFRENYFLSKSSFFIPGLTLKIKCLIWPFATFLFFPFVYFFPFLLPLSISFLWDCVPSDLQMVFFVEPRLPWVSPLCFFNPRTVSELLQHWNLRTDSSPDGAGCARPQQCCRTPSQSDDLISHHSSGFLNVTL